MEKGQGRYKSTSIFEVPGVLPMILEKGGEESCFGKSNRNSIVANDDNYALAA
jgi:hypothetical protein